MGNIITKSNTLFNVKINNTPSTNYTATDQTITISADNNPNIIPAGTLEKETNFAVSNDPKQIPDNIVPGKITVKIKKTDLSPDTNFLGLRLSADSAQGNFTFKVTNEEFDNTTKPVPSKNSAVINDFAWATVNIAALTADITETDFVLIPVEINYTGTSQNVSATFYVDIYTADNTTSGTISAVTTISETDDTVPQSITITSYTAAMTSSLMAAVPTALTVSKLSFYKNDPIALKTGFTTTTGDGYKPAVKLILTNTITSNITPVTLYASIIGDATDINDLEAGIIDGKVIKVDDFESLPADVEYTSGGDTVKITMDNTAGTFKDLFTGTDSTLPKSDVYIYIIGKVVGLGA
ncbi:hypothetical protein [uncultured Clostridium sp.]|uniref:hypothetical protein n=2 Tax=uncultured Clostridium sp. TaxID=59620 RepID=UPI0025CF45C5|nr:hypothetical protein [uncultured Clostridium sp.]